ncbi:MAG: putative lipid II flippase FtsW [Eubacteriaceae bacterium]|nr:putative lipid II flippase FtsW [Eubacteriaceae bacterium]
MRPKTAKIELRRRQPIAAEPSLLSEAMQIVREMPQQAKKPMDKTIVFLLFVLTSFGILMIWSASMYNAKLSGNEFYYVKKQLQVAIIGFAGMYFMSLANYTRLRRFAAPLLYVCIGLLVLVLMIGTDRNGAVRWLTIFGVALQPAEPAKLAVILFVSSMIERHMDQLSKFSGFMYVLAFTGFIAVLIYLQPALSTAVIVAGLIIGMYFIAGGNLFYIVALAGIAIGAVASFIMSSPWRMQRIFAFQDPWSDLTEKGWQPAQSLMALGSGGIFGLGIGNGRAKLMFLPEPQNDYIFSVIGEELGLIGCMAVIAIYFVLIFKLIKISLATDDIFGRLITSALGLLIAIQVFLNIAVVTNIVPPTGVMLPLISAGGSSLLTMLLSLGVALNVSRNTRSKG